MKLWWKFTHLSLFIGTDLEKFGIASLAHQCNMFWSEKLLVCNKQIHNSDFFFNGCFQLKFESSIHNIAFSTEKVIRSESGDKYAQIKHCLQQLYTNISMDLDMWGQHWWTFSLEEAILWIMELYSGQKQQFKVKHLNDGSVYFKYADFHFRRC